MLVSALKFPGVVVLQANPSDEWIGCATDLAVFRMSSFGMYSSLGEGRASPLVESSLRDWFSDIKMARRPDDCYCWSNALLMI